MPEEISHWAIILSIEIHLPVPNLKIVRICYNFASFIYSRNVVNFVQRFDIQYFKSCIHFDCLNTRLYPQCSCFNPLTSLSI